jgi:hypothetical protein
LVDDLFELAHGLLAEGNVKAAGHLGRFALGAAFELVGKPNGVDSFEVALTCLALLTFLDESVRIVLESVCLF